MPLTGLRRMDAFSGPAPRCRTRRLRLAALISLLIHLAIGFLLFGTIRHEDTPELLPPPAAVTMLFETGKRTGPTLPNPQPQAAPPLVAQPPAETLRGPALPPPAPLPFVVQPPVPPEPTPPSTFQTVEPVPRPQSQPEASPSPRPAPKQAVAPKPPDFPAPMNFSLGRPPAHPGFSARPQLKPHIPGTIDMSLGPAFKSILDPTPLSGRDAEIAGADWRNALSRWVAEHAYYPEQARRELEEGDAKVHVVAEPSGRVKDVELIGRSGSTWLDLALLALFRDQHIPRLPTGDNEPLEFNFTMHYILIRRP